MAADVLSSKFNIAISSPFHMALPRNIDGPPSRNPVPSSSRLDPSSSQLPPGPSATDAQPKTFKRLRTSLEQSLRTATKSKLKSHGVVVGEDGVVAQTMGKGKEKATDEQAVPKDKPKSSMLSRVSFRLAGGRNSTTPVPLVPAGRKESTHLERDRDKNKVREAGFTSFLTPSLRQASMSSPTLHLSSQAYPSPYSQPFAIPASSSNVAALVSPPRDRGKRQSTATKDISSPLPLFRRDPRTSGTSSPPPSTQEQKTHRPGRSLQIAVPSAYDSRSPPRRLSESPLPPETPRSRNRDLTRSPDLCPPSPSPRSGYLASKRAAASATHLPLSSPPGSPTTPRASSPTRVPTSPRSPTTPRAKASASSSHLPLTSSPSPTPGRRPSVDSPRRPSVDNPRRPSVEARRPSVDARRPSLDTQRPGRASPSSRAASPSTPIRPRAVSPTQRNFSPTFSTSRNFNVSTTSLITPSNPEQRELIRNASSVLLREMLKPPSTRGPSLDPLEYEEVELRLRSLSRLERVWGKSGGGANSSQVNVSGLTSSGLSAGGEDRERKQFAEALRDGYVLCQLINKFHPGTVTRVDKREDGFTRTANVTRFLAACSALGLKSDDLFNRDDFIESTPESLARVSKTIIALFAALESPAPERSKIVQGGAKNNPYGQGTASRATASTPNLQRSVSPSAAPTRQKRFSPPPLPVVRSDSPNESEGSSGTGTAVAATALSAGDKDTLSSLPSPPPRSPLRARPSMERSSIADSTRANISESVRGSITDSYAPSLATTRQSLASSHMSATTDTSAFSSLLEVQRSRSTSQGNKFGTIRTMTTEATSLSPSDMLSFFPAEAGSIPPSPGGDEYARKRGLDGNINPNPILKPFRERHPSETAFVDLSRVEEADESGSSANGKLRESSSSPAGKMMGNGDLGRNIRLGKGKWPDDFIDAFQSAPQRSPLLDEFDEADSIPSVLPTPLSVSPRSTTSSISPPRKLAIVTSRPEGSLDPLPQFPRRPSHRARHSVDVPGLMPKESILRRDSSPDIPPTPRIMVRRNSSKTGPHRNGIYIPRNSDEEDLVPFPRTVSGDLGGTPPTPSQGVHFPSNTNSDRDASKISTPSAGSSSKERPHQPPRGRFQSEIDGASARRKPRPSSYDEMGAKPRTRFESMVNLGGASGDASASDLMQSAGDGVVRQTLVVREDGKPATQFRLGPCIGRGQFGAVYRALNLNTGQMVAVKRIRLEGLKEEEIAQLMKEVDLVKSLSHPSIVKYEGMCRDESSLNIILEYAENGSLGQTIKAFGKLNERLVAGYVVKILEGLHYLHQSDVVHCDLKAANILTTKNGNVKLSDFGVSLNLRAMEREKDVAGTPNWMAPEVIELKGASTKSDIWSLACTVIELLTGRPPYGEIANSMSVMFRIVEDDMPPLPEGCSNLLRSFLTLCFNKDPSKRPDAETLFEHEWLKQNWAPHKDLRPQDSIPFLRRVSADMQKSEAIRYLAQIEMPDPPPERTPPEARPRLDEVMSGSPPRRRLSNDPDPISPREHSFVKTTFGKPVICRVCLQSVKKSAVLCEQCSLIAHTKCAPNAPPTCDLRSQLLLYAQYAENGASPGPYSHPMEILAAMSNGTPTSPNSESNFSSRPSLDMPPSPPLSVPGTPHPPTAFKVFTAAFKRSRSSLTTNDSDPTSPSSQPTAGAPAARERAISHKRSVLKRNPTSKDRRPPSTISSNNSSSNQHSHNNSQGASIRSSVVDRSSISSRPETVRQSTISIVETETPSMAERSDLRLSKMTSFSGVSTAGTEREDGRSEFGSIPGEMPREQQVKGNKSGKRDGCVVQ